MLGVRGFGVTEVVYVAVVELLPQALPTVHDTVYVPVAVLALVGAVTVRLAPEVTTPVKLPVDQLYVLDPVGPEAVYTWLEPGHTLEPGPVTVAEEIVGHVVTVYVPVAVPAQLYAEALTV